MYGQKQKNIMQPWMSNEEISLIEKYLKKNHIALEWGSGGSTVHFSKLVKEWNSIEHNKEWYLKVSKNKPKNVNLHYVGSDYKMNKRHGVSSKWPMNENFRVYANYPSKLNKKFDIVLVDGRARKWCALQIIPYLKKDSVVFIHDFWMRADRNYHDVFEYFDVIDKVTTGQSLVVLRLKKHISPLQFHTMEMKKNHKITTCISTNNNLEYLKLAIKSVRQNAYFYDMPIVVHAENCTDGTDIWLENNKHSYNLDVYIEHNETPIGIGGGMDFCVDKTKTEFVNIIHSDMWVAPNQDLELLKLYDNIDDNTRLIASSFRIQPKIFPSDPDYRPGTVFVPLTEFGEYHHNFDADYFNKWAVEFSKENDIIVRKAGGAGFFCRKVDYEWIGGNDPLFAPASWEDMDLFIRMQLEGYEFKMTSKSTVYHFSARGSHFRDEAKDNFSKKSKRQQSSEQINMHKFIEKWGRLPAEDAETFVKPIYNTNVKTRIKLK
jgi:GT2 family glycosyltransferase